jgi:AraC-like DNA-binding protein
MVMILLRLFLIIYTQVNNFDELETKIFISNYSSYEEIASFIYTIFIFIYAILMLTKNKKWFEYVLEYDDLKWIKHFLNLGVVIIIIWLIAIYRNSLDGSFSSPRIYYPLRLSTSILIYWVGFKGLFRYRVLEDRIILRENINKERVLKNNKNLSFTNEDYGNEEYPIIKSEKQQIIFDKINLYVKEHKKYLDPYLSLESLAKDLKISNGHLSFLINTYSEKHFTDYINEYRIIQVKELIIDDEYVNYTIESIGLESGFNSKSTFYSAFKKFTDLSPIQFKKQYVS